MDYTMHVSTKCLVTIPGILADADMNVDALYEMLRGSVGIPSITLTVKFSDNAPEVMSFNGASGLMDCAEFLKNNIHPFLRLRMQDITEVIAILEYGKL
jgi:hypothetical protein